MGKEEIKNDDWHRVELWQTEVYCPKCDTAFGLEKEIKKIREEAVECPVFYGSLHKMGRRWCPKCRFRLMIEVVEWGTMDPPYREEEEWPDFPYDWLGRPCY